MGEVVGAAGGSDHSIYGTHSKKAVYSILRGMHYSQVSVSSTLKHTDTNEAVYTDIHVVRTLHTPRSIHNAYGID